MIEYKVEEVETDHLEVYLNSKAKVGWKLISVSVSELGKTRIDPSYFVCASTYLIVWSVEDAIE